MGSQGSYGSHGFPGNTPVTVENLIRSGALDRLANTLGRAIADGIRERQDELDHAALEAARAADPLAASADAVLDALEPWAREAVRTPRAPGSPTAILLARTLDYLAARRAEKLSGPQPS